MNQAVLIYGHSEVDCLTLTPLRTHILNLYEMNSLNNRTLPISDEKVIMNNKDIKTKDLAPFKLLPNVRSFRVELND